jgi:hypothetical protein
MLCRRLASIGLFATAKKQQHTVVGASKPQAAALAGNQHLHAVLAAAILYGMGLLSTVSEPSR